MENKKPFRLPELSGSLKVVITCYVGTLFLGYFVALVQVYHRTQFDLAHTLLYYRGAESGDEADILTGPSFGTLLSVAHVHTMSQPVMLALLCLIFALTYVSQKAKVIFILTAFLSSVASNLAPWLVRYVSREMVMILPLSQMLLMLSFFVMAFVILYDVWRRPIGNKEFFYDQ